MVRIDAQSGGGTGFIFETTGDGKGYVLTNYHVIEGSARVTVRVNDANTYSAAILGYDAYRDLAVLEICCGRFRSLEMSSEGEVKPGTEVIAIGYPLDLEGSATVTRGIVSAVRYDADYRSWVIQTDAPINYGNSGGPLLLNNGQVIGVNSFIHERTISEAEGLGFAISQQSIKGVLENLKQGTRTGLPTATPTPVAVQWRTYTNHGSGYRIELPRDWEIDDSDTKDVTFTEPQDFALFNMFIPDWFISSAASELDSWLARQQREDNPVVFEILEKDSSRDANGIQTAYVRYRYQSELQYCIDVVEEILFVTPDRIQQALWVESRVCEHSYYEYQPMLDRMFNSIEAN